MRKKADQQDPDLTLKLGLVAGVPVAADNNARRVNHDLPVAPQPGLDLPRAAASLQPQDEQVVMTTETDQDPLPDVDPLAGEPQVAGSVSEVGANREETLGELKDRGRDENTNFLNRGVSLRLADRPADLQDDVLAGFPGRHGEQGARGSSGSQEQLDIRTARTAAASELVTNAAAQVEGELWDG